MSIKTLHLTNSYHPSSGGIRTFYQALLKAANRHKRNVRLVVPGEGTHVEDVGDYGRIYYIAAPQSPVLDSRYRMMLPHLYAWPYDSPLRQVIAGERPHLVEVCDKFMLCYLTGVLRRGWIRGVPVPALVGLTCERLDDNMAAFLSSGATARSLTRFYMRRLYVPRFDFHIAASDYIAAEVRAVLPRRMDGRLTVEPMGVDFEFFAKPRDNAALRKEIAASLGAGSQTVLLLYAGRLSKEKNLGLLPDLVVRLAACTEREFRLVVAGEGPLRADLTEELEKRAPGCSVFLGHCEREKLATLYQACDVFVHPNPREPFGIVPLEAMAAGLPVVAPASGGVLTYANQHNAWLTGGTAEGFAAAVLQLVENSAERTRRVEMAQRTAEQFSWTRVAANYFQLYDNLRERFDREGLAASAAANAPAPDDTAASSVP